MVSAMWSRVLRRSVSRTHGKWAVVFLLAGASKSRWFWSSSRLKSGRLSSANFHVRSRTVSHSSKNFSIFPAIRKHLRRRLGAVLFSVLTGCRNQRRGRGSDRQWHGDPGALLQRDFPLMPFFVIPGWLALIMGFLLLGSALLRARMVPRWAGVLLLLSALVLLGFNDQDVRVLLAVPLGLSWVVVGSCLGTTQDGPQGGHVAEEKPGS